MKFELEEYHRDTPDDELIADLKRVAADLGSVSFTRAAYQTRGRFHPSTLDRRFGSWRAALDLAGLVRSRNYAASEDELFENLANLWELLGRQPRASDFDSGDSRFAAKTYANRFGGWRGALRAFVAWANDGEQAVNERPKQGRAPRVKPATTRTRWKVMERDGFRCVMCGASPANDRSVKLHVDHRRARANGGTSDLTNLQTLCERCNLGKGSALSLDEA